jgi:hypothetical protein
MYPWDYIISQIQSNSGGGKCSSVGVSANSQDSIIIREEGGQLLHYKFRYPVSDKLSADIEVRWLMRRLRRF